MESRDETRDALDVVAAVVVDEGRVLACRRRPGKAAAGKWEFPGGKVESGESPSDALAREIQEELGVPIAIQRELLTSVTQVGERLIRLACFVCVLIGERPRSSTDHDRMEWLPVIELDSLDWAAPDLPAVRELVDAASGR